MRSAAKPRRDSKPAKNASRPMRRVHTHAVAKRDLVDHFVYLGEQAGIDTAERFLECVEKSFTELLARTTGDRDCWRRFETGPSGRRLCGRELPAGTGGNWPRREGEG